ncbi:hypothetical protein CTI12_AA397760 [Artemisia annua]|uniref:Uncharacterized protein n=1 Tax=Artemisia annua TaxID=35608 RepID=A0A2U1MBK6_ARTAN|nr:hypothetical protein CTI12_AA397760 [Artemisia annua]
MGGGVAMRAAAKVAGMGVLNTGLRGSEHPVAAAARQLSRLVFGGVPSVQEAKEAACDLNHALEMTYLHPNATNPDVEHVETKSSLVSETLVTPSAPKGAIQAFRLLSENPQAQTVVASIASDPNVWSAVMQNPELVDFLHTHRTVVKDASGVSSEAGESESSPGKGFMEYVEDVKQKINVTVEDVKQKINVTVVDMMNTLSDTFQSLFCTSSKGGFVINPDGTAALTAENVAVGASLMGLAIMVITVVVLKRS